MKFLGVSLKMYFDHQRTLAWTGRIIEAVESAGQLGAVEVVLFPSFVSIPAVVDLVGRQHQTIRVGAQNVADHASGPFTGEVSAASLKQVGCHFVEIGHAERRRLFGENNAIASGKVAAALDQGMVPLLCVGEPGEVAMAAAGDYCIEQLEAILGSLAGDQLAGQRVDIAYEPVASIGASRPADEQHILAVCQQLSRWASRECPDTSVRVVYGGSAGPGLLSRLGVGVDGLFLGRFAHDPEAFAQVLAEASGQPKRSD
ncbi:MAG: triose-phosphate isomerase [Micrococcales bacterium]|nr:triose-phosphate isomerase [Micrococcales bacterium]